MNVDRFMDPNVWEGEEDEEIAPEEPRWVPVALPETERQQKQQASDTRACNGARCQLCGILDSNVDGCTEFLKRIFQMEEEYRDLIDPALLYEINTNRYNGTVYRRTCDFYGESDAKRRGLFPLTRVCPPRSVKDVARSEIWRRERMASRSRAPGPSRLTMRFERT